MNDDTNLSGQQRQRTARHGHGLMMLMCVPMLLIAVVLVATGIASPGILVGAAMCVAMMALMMRGMSHGKA